MNKLYPWIIDAILIGVVLEFLIIRFLLIRANAKLYIRPVFFFLLSGGFLLVAMRFSMSDASVSMTSFALFFAFVSHLGTLAAVVRLISKQSKF